MFNYLYLPLHIFVCICRFFTLLCCFLSAFACSSAATDISLCCPLLSDCVCHSLDNCGNCPSTRPERRRAKSECWQSRHGEFVYFALCLCICIFTYFCLFLRYTRAEKCASSVVYPTRRTSGRSRITGKGNETIEKTRKNFPYLLCQHSDFGADTAEGCAKRDGRSPAKLHRQKWYPNHGGTGKVR